MRDRGERKKEELALSREEREKIFERIMREHAEGKGSYNDLVDKSKVNRSTFHGWKAKRTAPEVIVHESEPITEIKRAYRRAIPQSSKCVVIVTDTLNLASVLKGLT